jgi:ferrous iron transport protein B
VVPLISGTACAIPAIMATRNIENWKNDWYNFSNSFHDLFRRLPVYAIIIVIPDERLFGFLNMQGMTLMLLYLGFEWQFSLLYFE